MANLPRFGRTWQRFTSLPGRPSSATSQPEQLQPPAVTAEPELFPSAPATTQILRNSPLRENSSRLQSPVKKFASPPSSPKYRPTATSPSKSAPFSPTPTYNRYDGERRTSAMSSPKTHKPTHTSPPLSPPKHGHPAPAPAPAAVTAPLSPLTLPRSEMKHEPGPMVRSRSPPEVEQKTILYQKPAEKPGKSDHRQSEYSSGKPQQKQQQQQQQSDVINIRGENVGAVMHITQSSDGTESVKKKPTVGSHNENEEKSNKLSSLPAKSFLNSNFQGVNNSILYNSSFTHRDPGLHLAFSRKPTTHAHPISS